MWIPFTVVLSLGALSILMLRRQARAWSERRISGFGVLLGGAAAWLTFLSILGWLFLVISTGLQYLETSEDDLLWILLINAVLSGFLVNFLVRSRTALAIDDTYSFFQQSLVFRKTDYHTVDVRMLAEREERRRALKKRKEEELLLQDRSDPKAWERMRLEDDLAQRKRQDLRLKQVRGGAIIDIMDEWNARTSGNRKHLLYEAVSAVSVDGEERRIALVLDLSAFHQRSFQNESLLPGLYQEVYDLLQTLMTERWLKIYLQHCPAFALTCRALAAAADGSDFFYPFLKVQITPARLDELAVSFFDGSSLPQAVPIVYNKGLPV